MQPSEISGQLPNGFHGAFVEQLRVDYRAKTAEYLLQLLVPMDKANPHSESRFRSGRFRVSGLAFLSADVPDPQYDFIDDSPIELGSCWIRRARSSRNFRTFKVSWAIPTSFIAF